MTLKDNAHKIALKSAKNSKEKNKRIITKDDVEDAINKH